MRAYYLLNRVTGTRTYMGDYRSYEDAIMFAASCGIGPNYQVVEHRTLINTS